MRVALVALGLFALYFAAMGSYPLVDVDEPAYGQVAKEMAAGAGWLTPHYDGKPWFDKPPLFYWLSGASVKLFGPTEFACRLPSAILAVGVLFLLYALVKYDFGKRAALLSCLVLATSLQMIILARAAVTDMTLLFCLLGALYAYRRWFGEVESETCNLRWMAACGAFTGLGMLAKGPVAPALLFATFFIHLWISGRLRRLVSLDALAGVATALIVGLPWFVAMYLIHRDLFVQGFLVANNITRFLKPEHAGQTGGWYSYLLNIPTLFVFFFPWSVFLPSGLLRFRGANAGAKLAAIWFGVVFVFFSLSKTQLVTYIFPLYPAAALFVGVLLDRATSGENGTEKSVRKGLIAMLVMSILIDAGLMQQAHAKFPGAMAAACAMGGVLVLAAILARTWKMPRSAWTIGTGMVAFTSILMFGLVPKITPNISTQEILRVVPRDARVVNYGLWKPSLFFYLGRNPERITDKAVIRRLLAGQESTWVICKDTNVRLLPLDTTVEVARMGGLSVITNETATNRKGSGRN